MTVICVEMCNLGGVQLRGIGGEETYLMTAMLTGAVVLAM